VAADTRVVEDCKQKRCVACGVETAFMMNNRDQ